jgi:hypothetical protein
MGEYAVRKPHPEFRVAEGGEVQQFGIWDDLGAGAALKMKTLVCFGFDSKPI